MDITEKWALILGSESQLKSKEAFDSDQIHQALEKLYPSQNSKKKIDPTQLMHWLEEWTSLFPKEAVQLMQKDALEKIELKKILKEPDLLEKMEPDVQLVSKLLVFKDELPEDSLQILRKLVEKLCFQLSQKINWKLEQNFGIYTKNFNWTTQPPLKHIDWNKTIRKNLKNYHKELQTIIPTNKWGKKHSRSDRRKLYLCVDKSASMMDSVINSTVMASVLYLLPQLEVFLFLFDTEVYDFTDQIHDPVSTLLSIKAEGGTHITEMIQLINQRYSFDDKSFVVFITDLYEGKDEKNVVKAFEKLKSKDVECLCLVALDIEGKLDYNKNLANELIGLGIPVLSSNLAYFPVLLGKMLNKETGFESNI